MFMADIKANRQQIRKAVNKLQDTEVTKPHNLTRPDGEKACAQAVPGYDALWVVNQTGDHLN